MDTRDKDWRLRLFGIPAFVVACALALAAVYWFRPLLLLDAYAALSRARAGLAVHRAVIDGDRWVWDERDEDRAGQTLVLVHGFAGSRQDWYAMLPYLPRHGRLVIVDLPGWGASGHRTHHDYRARAQARRLARFLDSIDARHVHLVGHSMGGKISGIAAARYPGRVERLTLIAPSGVHFEPNDFVRRVLAGEDPFSLHNRADYERLLRDGFERPPRLPRRVEDALVAANRHEHAFLDRMLDVLRRGEHRYALEPALSHLKMSVHVVWCRPDRILDVSSVATLRRLLPTARYDIIEAGCGHMPMMEVPDTLAALIEATPIEAVVAR